MSFLSRVSTDELLPVSSQQSCGGFWHLILFLAAVSTNSCEEHLALVKLFVGVVVVCCCCGLQLLSFLLALFLASLVAVAVLVFVAVADHMDGRPREAALVPLSRCLFGSIP